MQTGSCYCCSCCCCCWEMQSRVRIWNALLAVLLSKFSNDSSESIARFALPPCADFSVYARDVYIYDARLGLEPSSTFISYDRLQSCIDHHDVEGAWSIVCWEGRWAQVAVAFAGSELEVHTREMFTMGLSQQSALEWDGFGPQVELLLPSVEVGCVCSGHCRVCVDETLSRTRQRGAAAAAAEVAVAASAMPLAVATVACPAASPVADAAVPVRMSLQQMEGDIHWERAQYGNLLAMVLESGVVPGSQLPKMTALAREAADAERFLKARQFL